MMYSYFVYFQPYIEPAEPAELVELVELAVVPAELAVELAVEPFEPVEPFAVLVEPVVANAANAANAVTESAAKKCSQNASLLSTVPPECITLGPVPQFHELMEAAIEYPIHKAAGAGAEMATDALKATGNAALVEIATKKALGPEDAKLLNEMSKDPKVAAELEKFQNNMSNVVEHSIEQLGDSLKKPIEDAAEKITVGAINTATNAAANVPIAGVAVTLATAAGTVEQLTEQANDIMHAVEDAKRPVDLAMAQVTDVTDALDEAVKNAIPKVELPDVPKVEVPKVELPKVELPKVEVPKVELQKVEVPKVELPKVEVPKVPVPKVPVSVAPATRGGSRKRRRIHKLSRRIERTLRRVQKKYGLQDDKNSFLRRTLRSGTHVPLKP